MSFVRTRTFIAVADESMPAEVREMIHRNSDTLVRQAGIVLATGN